MIKKYFLGTIHARLGSSSSLRCGLRLPKKRDSHTTLSDVGHMSHFKKQITLSLSFKSLKWLNIGFKIVQNFLKFINKFKKWPRLLAKNELLDTNKQMAHFCRGSPLVSISSTFYVQIFCAYVISEAFSSYVLALAKKSYEKCTSKTLMKSTPGLVVNT